jgi:hypothetical protein
VSDRFFPYDFDKRFVALLVPFGVRPKTDGVTLTEDGRFLATFGRFRVETALSNIKGATKTGPYKWWRAVGPRGSGVDSGITFGTTPRGGVCILFTERIPNVIPPAPRHAGLTVTVADRDGLVDALTNPI